MKKFIETVCLIAVSTSIIFFLPLLDKDCEPEVTEGTEASLSYVRYQCPENTYNGLATLFFNTEGHVIKIFLKWSENGDFDSIALVLFFLAWYILTIVSYGTAVPAGLFLPGILIGCGVGVIYGNILKSILGTFDFN
jgi:chloride channel 7